MYSARRAMPFRNQFVDLEIASMTQALKFDGEARLVGRTA
jgi:hypothetical protein